MSKKMLIDATHAEETRVVVVDGNKVEEFDFESVNKRQLAGNIYLAKVTRVEPSLQAAFVDYGGNRHGFLAFSEIHPDYYQIPVADREALLAEEAAYAKAQAEDDGQDRPKSRRRRRNRKSVAEKSKSDAVVTKEADASEISGMDVVDVDVDTEALEPMGFGNKAEPQTAETTDAAAAEVATADVTVADVDAPAETPEPAQAETSVDDQPAENADASPVEAETISEDATSDDAAKGDDDSADDDNSDEDDEEGSTAQNRDPNIESVAQEDEQEDIRPRRKPRPRRYKIQEVIKVRQILLIQVVKEERGNKGAALTTYLSLAGRYCVLMPNTARGGGISRKITNAADRKKLKEIASNIEVPTGAGLIIRTAGAKRTKAEIKRDYDYLLRQWEEVRELTLKSIAPAPIYEEGSLIKRSIRDLYNKEIDEVLIEGEAGYRVAKDYMKMLMPSHAKNVKQYTDPMPLFARFQVESYLAGMFNPTVQLRSGGYIVIGVTEALVAIDVNSGRATKEGSIEDTALKTNLEAAEEVARQLRLRDLAGLIVIDFIDMEERRNNTAVEKRIKDRLKTDRARIQVGRISGFGLMEMSRQRLRPGMIEATTAPCPHCHGTGLTRSDDNLALAILRELEEEGVRRRAREVLVTAPIAISNYLLNQKREHIAMIESRYGLSVRVEADPHLISPEYKVEKFKTASRVVPEPTAEVVSIETSLLDTPAAEETEVETPVSAEGDDDAPRKKRRRRRRRGGRGRNGKNAENQENAAESADGDDAETEVGENTTGEPTDATSGAEDAAPEAAIADAPSDEATAEPAADKPKKRAPRKPRAKKPVAEETAEDGEVTSVGEASSDEVAAEPKEKPKRKPRTRRKKADDKKADDVVKAEGATGEAEAPVEAPAEAISEPQEEVPAEAPKKRAPRKRKPAAQPAKQTSTETSVEAPTDTPEEAPVDNKPAETPAAPAPAAEAAAQPVETPAEKPADDKPKRRGWWSRG